MLLPRSAGPFTRWRCSCSSGGGWCLRLGLLAAASEEPLTSHQAQPPPAFEPGACTYRRWLKISHPLERFSKLGLLRTKYDSKTNWHVFGQLPARSSFQRQTAPCSGRNLFLLWSNRAVKLGPLGVCCLVPPTSRTYMYTPVSTHPPFRSRRSHSRRWLASRYKQRSLLS